MSKKSKQLTKKQFRAALEGLGLPITGASPYVGMSPRQLQRIAAKGEDTSPVPHPVSKLINLAKSGKVTLDDLLDA